MFEFYLSCVRIFTYVYKYKAGLERYITGLLYNLLIFLKIEKSTKYSIASIEKNILF